MKTARINGIILFCALLPMLAALAGCVDKTPVTQDPVISVADPSPIAPEASGTRRPAQRMYDRHYGVRCDRQQRGCDFPALRRIGILLL